MDFKVTDGFSRNLLKTKTTFKRSGRPDLNQRPLIPSESVMLHHGDSSCMEIRR